MLADGSQPTRLTNGPGANTTPWWTPDGKKILFVSSRDAINGELYLMNPDGSDPVRVTNDSTVKDTPVMTPDGKEVLFTVNTKGRYRIASYSMDSKVFQFLTPPDYNSAHPSISPDGAAFLFASDMDGTSEIFSMPLAGGTATKITGGTGGATTPTWTNDPEQVLISRKGGICLLALKTKKEIILTYRGDSAPQWQSR
jgi:Tol biopolymer transport system component